MRPLKAIDYGKLNAPQQENFNFQKVAGLLADYGFNCIRLSDDWQGADFLAYSSLTQETLRVQLKSRLSVAKKYIPKGLYVAFPLHAASLTPPITTWYFMPHNELLTIIKRKGKYVTSPSWKKGKAYSIGKPGREIVKALERFKIGSYPSRSETVR